MTRFEVAKQNEREMAIMTSFCIAAYMEQSRNIKFSHDELIDFMTIVSEDVEIWLKQEDGGKQGGAVDDYRRDDTHTEGQRPQ